LTEEHAADRQQKPSPNYEAVSDDATLRIVVVANSLRVDVNAAKFIEFTKRLNRVDLIQLKKMNFQLTKTPSRCRQRTTN
jgi:hypothetical protein